MTIRDFFEAASALGWTFYEQLLFLDTLKQNVTPAEAGRGLAALAAHMKEMLHDNSTTKL